MSLNQLLSEGKKGDGLNIVCKDIKCISIESQNIIFPPGGDIVASNLSITNEFTVKCDDNTDLFLKTPNYGTLNQIMTSNGNGTLQFKTFNGGGGAGPMLTEDLNIGAYDIKNIPVYNGLSSLKEIGLETQNILYSIPSVETAFNNKLSCTGQMESVGIMSNAPGGNNTLIGILNIDGNTLISNGNINLQGNDIINGNLITSDSLTISNQTILSGSDILSPAVLSSFGNTQSKINQTTQGGKWTIIAPLKINAIAIPVGHWSSGSSSPRSFNIWPDGNWDTPLYTYLVPRTNIISGYYQYDLPTVITLVAGTYRHGITFEAGQMFDSNNNFVVDSRFSNNRAVNNISAGGLYPQSIDPTRTNAWYSGQLIIDDSTPSLIVTGKSQIENLFIDNTVIQSQILHTFLDGITPLTNLVGNIGSAFKKFNQVWINELWVDKINNLTPVGGMCSGISDGLVISGGSVTSLLPTNYVGTLNFLSNSLNIGDVFHIVCAGTILTSNNDDDITIKIYLNGIALSTITTSMEAGSNTFFELEVDLQLRSIGTDSRIATNMDLTFNKSPFDDFKGTRKSQLSAIDTTIDNLLSISCQFTGPLSSTLQTRLFYIRKQY